jgi:hypothetical protein
MSLHRAQHRRRLSGAVSIDLFAISNITFGANAATGRSARRRSDVWHDRRRRRAAARRALSAQPGTHTHTHTHCVAISSSLFNRSLKIRWRSLGTNERIRTTGARDRRAGSLLLHGAVRARRQHHRRAREVPQTQGFVLFRPDR